MKDVQCYELFGGITLKNYAFSFSRSLMAFLQHAGDMLCTCYAAMTLIALAKYFVCTFHSDRKQMKRF